MYKSYLYKKIEQIFGLDFRGLAFLRISVGALLLIDLYNRLPDLSVHYSDLGVLPRSLLLDQQGQYGFSLHMSSGDFYFQALVFLLAAVSAVSLVFGYKTRLVSVISWILLVSLQHRNPLVLCAEDTVIKLVVFWGMFLPWGERYSLDSLLKGPRLNQKQQVFSLPGFCFIAQIFMMYIFSGYLKWGDEWVKDGTALSYVLNYGQIIRSCAPLLLQNLALLKILTFGTVYLERFGPLLWLSPVWTPYFRFISLSCFILLHWGIWLTMDIDFFPIMCIAILISLMPKEVWDILTSTRVMTESTLAKMREKLLRFLPSPAIIPKTPERKVMHYLKIAAVNIFLVMALGYVIIFNLSTLHNSKLKVPQSLNLFSDVFGLNQTWTVFAPNVGKDDGWVVVAGTLKDGSQVDVFQNGKPLTFNKPLSVLDSLKNTHWRQYMMSLINNRYIHYRSTYGNYVCRQWNSQHSNEKRLKNIEFVYMMEYSLPLGKKAPPQRQRIFTWNCF